MYKVWSMKISMAHLRERAQSGGWINFAVFDAKPTDGDKDRLLHTLTLRARATGLRVDQSALAFSEHGRLQFYGTPSLVKYLSQMGVPRWTHTLDV